LPHANNNYSKYLNKGIAYNSGICAFTGYPEPALSYLQNAVEMAINHTHQYA